MKSYISVAIQMKASFQQYFSIVLFLYQFFILDFGIIECVRLTDKHSLTIKLVLELPSSPSCRSLVSVEFLYGIWRLVPSANA